MGQRKQVLLWSLMEGVISCIDCDRGERERGKGRWWARSEACNATLWHQSRPERCVIVSPSQHSLLVYCTFAVM